MDVLIMTWDTECVIEISEFCYHFSVEMSQAIEKIDSTFPYGFSLPL